MPEFLSILPGPAVYVPEISKPEVEVKVFRKEAADSTVPPADSAVVRVDSALVVADSSFVAAELSRVEMPADSSTVMEILENRKIQPDE